MRNDPRASTVRTIYYFIRLETISTPISYLFYPKHRCSIELSCNEQRIKKHRDICTFSWNDHSICAQLKFKCMYFLGILITEKKIDVEYRPILNLHHSGHSGTKEKKRIVPLLTAESGKQCRRPCSHHHLLMTQFQRLFSSVYTELQLTCIHLLLPQISF